MNKPLTKEQVEARINMYQEAIDHLTSSVHDNKEEMIQSEIVRRQIFLLMKKFSDKYESQYNKEGQ